LELKRLYYDNKVRTRYILPQKSIAEGLNLKYDDTYLNYHNNICPRCRKEMIVKNGNVKNIGAIGAGILQTTGYYYPYAVCKECSVDMEKSSRKHNEVKSSEIEEYVGKVIPHLAP
jgi:hypothetical protein